MTATPPMTSHFNAIGQQALDARREKARLAMAVDVEQQYRYTVAAKPLVVEAFTIQPGTTLGHGNIPARFLAPEYTEVLTFTPAKSVKAERATQKGTKTIRTEVALSGPELGVLLGVGRIQARVWAGTVVAEPVDDAGTGKGTAKVR